MEEKDLPKKTQHYIAQVYVRGFSPEYEPMEKATIPKEKYTIFSYDLEKKAYDSTEAVPIKSICYKKVLYEIYGADEKIIFPNWLENYFHILEKMYGKYRSELERKIHKENIGIPNFLTTKERTFWALFIAIHLLRNLYVLSETEAVIKNLLNSNTSDKEIKSLARKMCLPFFLLIDENSTETRILEEILKPMYKMQFVVCVDFDNHLITSDKGASIIRKEISTDEYDEIIFPITSSICLLMLGNENKGMYPENTMAELNEEGKKYITTNVVLDAYKKIYSNHRFSVQEKKFIKEIATERVQVNKD